MKIRTLSTAYLSIVFVLLFAGCRNSQQDDSSLDGFFTSDAAEEFIESLEDSTTFSLISNNPESCREQIVVLKASNGSVSIQDQGHYQKTFEATAEDLENPFETVENKSDSYGAEDPVLLLENIGFRFSMTGEISGIQHTRKRVDIRKSSNKNKAPFFFIEEKIDTCIEMRVGTCLFYSPKTITTELKFMENLEYLEITFTKAHRSQLMIEKESTCLYQKK